MGDVDKCKMVGWCNKREYLCCWNNGTQIFWLIAPSVWKSLQPHKAIPDVIQYVYDGEQYKKHFVFLSHHSHVSFTCNSDGVVIFRSSKVELWPVWLCINELPGKPSSFCWLYVIVSGNTEIHSVVMPPYTWTNCYTPYIHNYTLNIWKKKIWSLEHSGSLLKSLLWVHPWDPYW